MMRPPQDVSLMDIFNWLATLVHTGILGWLFMLWRKLDRAHRTQAVREYQNKIVWEYVAKQIGIDPKLNGHARGEE